MIHLTADFQTELHNANIPLTVFPSQEFRVNGDLLSALDEGDILTTDDQGMYMVDCKIKPNTLYKKASETLMVIA